MVREVVYKICKWCQAEKTLDSFAIKGRGVDGRHCYCKECHRARYGKRYYERRHKKTLLREKQLEEAKGAHRDVFFGDDPDRMI